MDNCCILHRDIFPIIFSWLPSIEFYSVIPLVCKWFHTCTHNISIWREILQRESDIHIPLDFLFTRENLKLVVKISQLRIHFVQNLLNRTHYLANLSYEYTLTGLHVKMRDIKIKWDIGTTVLHTRFPPTEPRKRAKTGKHTSWMQIFHEGQKYDDFDTNAEYNYIHQPPLDSEGNFLSLQMIIVLVVFSANVDIYLKTHDGQVSFIGTEKYNHESERCNHLDLSNKLFSDVLKGHDYCLNIFSSSTNTFNSLYTCIVNCRLAFFNGKPFSAFRPCCSTFGNLVSATIHSRAFSRAIKCVDSVDIDAPSCHSVKISDYEKIYPTWTMMLPHQIPKIQFY